MGEHNLKYFFKLKLGEKCPTCRRKVTKNLLREKQSLLKLRQTDLREKLKEAGLRKRKFDWDKAKEMHQSGVRISEIASTLSVSKEAVYLALRKMNS